jgi:hypothetical protein
MPPEPFTPPADEYEDVDETQRPVGEKPAKDETPNAADPKQIARALQKQRFTALQIEEFWRNKVLSDPVGRRAVWELLEALHAFDTRFASTPAGFPCPEATWFQAGETNAGDRVFKSMLRRDFAATHLMLQEFHPDFIVKKPRRSAPKDD